MKRLLLSENSKAAFYLLIGSLVSFILTLHVVDKINFDKEKDLVYLTGLQSCYFSGMKQVPNPDDNRIGEFCKNHATQLRDNYGEVSRQMNEVLDKKYSIWNYLVGQGPKAMKQNR